MKPTSNNFFALAVIAHPDDEAFLMSGTTMKFAEEGKSTAIVCATRGEKGTDRLNRGLTQQQMADIRSNELKKACSMIHCDCVELLNYPDGELDSSDFDTLVADIVSKIDEYAPEIILTFGKEGISGHKDHVTIGKAAIQAAKTSQHRPKEVWLASMPESIMDKFNEHLNQRKVHYAHFHEHKLKGEPDVDLMKVDIRKYSDLKSQALKAHESQYIRNLTFDLFLEYEYFNVLRLP